MKLANVNKAKEICSEYLDLILLRDRLASGKYELIPLYSIRDDCPDDRPPTYRSDDGSRVAVPKPDLPNSIGIEDEEILLAMEDAARRSIGCKIARLEVQIKKL